MMASEFAIKFRSLGDINRIGEAFRDSPQSPSTVQAMQEYRSFRMRCLQTTLQIVNAAKLPERCIVSVRLKRLDSILQKINRPDGNFTLAQMDDIIGVRVICETLTDAYGLNQRIQSLPEYYKSKDYMLKKHDTGSGYRAVHNIMRFKQLLSEDKRINIRFEIQVRSYYQHQWAVWSESKGEAVKAGKGAEDTHSELRNLSERIARWEGGNADVEQARLPVYSDNARIVVAWRQKPTPMLFPFFSVDSAVQHLNYLENRGLSSRRNALLLVGLSDPSRDNVDRILQITHPLYTSPRVPPPELWMPPGS